MPSMWSGTIGASTRSRIHSRPRLKPRICPIREMPPSEKMPMTSPEARPDWIAFSACPIDLGFGSKRMNRHWSESIRMNFPWMLGP